MTDVLEEEEISTLTTQFEGQPWEGTVEGGHMQAREEASRRIQTW